MDLPPTPSGAAFLFAPNSEKHHPGVDFPSETLQSRVLWIFQGIAGSMIGCLHYCGSCIIDMNWCVCHFTAG